MELELIYIEIICLLLLGAYLLLYRWMKRKGETTAKRMVYNIISPLHLIALVQLLLSAILCVWGWYFRWGITSYAGGLLLLSGIIIYLTVPKLVSGYRWRKIYSGIYYWGVAILLPLTMGVLFFLYFTVYKRHLYEDCTYTIYDETPDSSDPRSHDIVIYENKCLFLKEVAHFKFDRINCDIYDVKRLTVDTIQVDLRERESSLNKVATRDTTLFVIKGQRRADWAYDPDSNRFINHFLFSSRVYLNFQEYFLPLYNNDRFYVMKNTAMGNIILLLLLFKDSSLS